MLASTLDGEPRPAGDMDLEPGGDSVEAYSVAADGFDLRYDRLEKLVSESDMESGSVPVIERSILGDFKAEAAAAGNACIGSVGEVSSLKGCGMKATGESWRKGELASAPCV